VDSIDTGGGNLTDTLYIDLAPFRSIGANPDIFISLLDPKGGTSAEDGRLTLYVSLYPIRMVFEKRMLLLVCISCNTFESSNVNECLVADFMCLPCNCTNRFQFFTGVSETLVSARDVIVRFDAEDVRLSCAPDDVIHMVEAKAVLGNASKVGP